jgi:hypothetical protein
MTDLPTWLAIALGLTTAGALTAAGYALGLGRVLGRLPVDEEPPPPPPLARVHTVILDGIAESGKSTLIHRLAFPCTDRPSLARLRATREAVRTRTLPVCFEPQAGGGEVLHSLRYSDVSGERPGQIADTIDALHGEHGGGGGRVIALWVWDMANTPRCRAELTASRMRAAYGTAKARELVKGVVVFLNKLDLLTVEPAHLARLVAEEERHLRALVTSCFDQGVPVVVHRGSALDGTGVTDCQGAIYDAIGLGHHFRLADSGDGAATAAIAPTGPVTP